MAEVGCLLCATQTPTARGLGGLIVQKLLTSADAVSFVFISRKDTASSCSFAAGSQSSNSIAAVLG